MGVLIADKVIINELKSLSKRQQLIRINTGPTHEYWPSGGFCCKGLLVLAAEPSRALQHVELVERSFRVTNHRALTLPYLG